MLSTYLQSTKNIRPLPETGFAGQGSEKSLYLSNGHTFGHKSGHLGKGYLGKTVTCLRTRINGHRALFYKVINNPSATILDNKYNNDLSLGYHLHKEHNCIDRKDFNKFYRFTIVQHCGPNNIDVTEHKWIHRLRTLEPGGINAVNPFSIPLIQ